MPFFALYNVIVAVMVVPSRDIALLLKGRASPFFSTLGVRTTLASKGLQKKTETEKLQSKDQHTMFLGSSIKEVRHFIIQIF